MVTPNGRTLGAGDAGETAKTAGVTVYLMEELGDARMRCDQLLRYIEKASQLIEKSAQKDRLFEVAGDMIRGVPETAFKLHKALQAVALAASRLDYEEIKQDLRPEKVEELERVLKDVRVRQVQRRSLPMINPGKVVQELRSLAKQARDNGRVDTDGLSALIAALESGAPKVAKEAKEKAATQLEAMAHALENPPAGEQPSRFRLAQVLRRTLAENIELASEGFETQASIEPQPRDPDEVTKALADFLKYARLVDSTGGAGDYKRMLGNLIGVLNQVQYLTNIFDIEGTGYVQRVVKAIMPYTNLRPMANFASEGFETQASIDAQPRDPAEVTKALADFIKYARLVDSSGGAGNYKRMLGNLIGVLNQVQYLTNIFDIQGTGYVQRVVKAIMPYTNLRPMANFASVRASDDDKRSRYEEGKPADPTENMSDAEAKEWRANTEEYGDKFKKEAASRAPDVIFKRMKEAVDGLLAARVKIRVVHEDLSGIASDATGTVFTNNYRNAEIDKVSKDLYELDHTIGQAFRDIERLEKTMKQTMVKSAAEDEDKQSRYEEGESADPTENMSKDDAKAWKENTEEYGDKFKAAASRSVTAVNSLEPNKWYASPYTGPNSDLSKDKYFYTLSQQKNKKWLCIAVEARSTKNAAKGSYGDLEYSRWKDVAESAVPDKVKQWARTKMASESTAEDWKVA